MSRNLSMGPVQIFSTDVASLNLAFAQVQERLDALKGLRGRSEIWDQARAEDPSERQDVITLGRLDDAETVTNVTFLAAGGAGLLVRAPGVAYVEISPALRQSVNFNATQPLEARVSISGWGTEAGAAKAVAITRDDDSVIAQVVWDGNAEAIHTGDYTDITLEMDQVVRVHARGSSLTESLILSRISFDMRYNTLSA